MLCHFGEVTTVLRSPGGVGLLTALRPPQADVGLQTWSTERVTEASRGRFRPRSSPGSPMGLAVGGPVPHPALAFLLGKTGRGGGLDHCRQPMVLGHLATSAHASKTEPLAEAGRSPRALGRSVPLWFRTREMRLGEADAGGATQPTPSWM